MLLTGQLGVRIVIYQGRVVVAKQMASRTARLGEACKPHVGDILVAVNEKIVPPGSPLERVMGALRGYLQKPEPVLFWFVEDSEFKEHWEKIAPLEARRRRPPPQPSATIDLIED